MSFWKECFTGVGAMGRDNMQPESAESTASRIKNQVGLSFRCSEYEAARIREAAKRERRTVSSYVLNAVMMRISNQQRVLEISAKSLHKNSTGPLDTPQVGTRDNWRQVE